MQVVEANTVLTLNFPPTTRFHVESFRHKLSTQYESKQKGYIVTVTQVSSNDGLRRLEVDVTTRKIKEFCKQQKLDAKELVEPCKSDINTKINNSHTKLT